MTLQQEIFNYIWANNGVAASKIADYFQLKLNTLSYHLKALEAAGSIRTERKREGSTQIKYCYAVIPVDHGIIAAGIAAVEASKITTDRDAALLASAFLDRHGIGVKPHLLSDTNMIDCVPESDADAQATPQAEADAIMEETETDDPAIMTPEPKKVYNADMFVTQMADQVTDTLRQLKSLQAEADDAVLFNTLVDMIHVNFHKNTQKKLTELLGDASVLTLKAKLRELYFKRI